MAEANGRHDAPAEFEEDVGTKWIATHLIAPPVTAVLSRAEHLADAWARPRAGTGSSSQLWDTLYGAVCALIEGVARIPAIGSRDDDLSAQDLAGHVMNLVHEAIIDGVADRGIATRDTSLD